MKFEGKEQRYIQFLHGVGLTQKHIAEYTGVSREHINRVWTGKRHAGSKLSQDLLAMVQKVKSIPGYRMRRKPYTWQSEKEREQANSDVRIPTRLGITKKRALTREDVETISSNWIKQEGTCTICKSPLLGSPTTAFCGNVLSVLCISCCIRYQKYISPIEEKVKR